MILADLGCEISTLAVDMNSKVFQTGSSDGNQFLSSNPEIGIKFRVYFGELQEFSYFHKFYRKWSFIYMHFDPLLLWIYDPYK